MTFGSVFSGIGAECLGLERAGMTPLWQIENDPYCLKILEKHWPEVWRWDDARTFLRGAAWRARKALWQADCIAAGPPCQPVSVAGRRQGERDEQWLWGELWRIIRVLRPRYLLLENPPGLFSMGFGGVLGTLAALGYDAEWDTIPACAFGAPHIRQRIFIRAYRRAADVEVPAVEGTDADATINGRHAWRAGDATQGAERRESGGGGVDAVASDASRSRSQIWQSVGEDAGQEQSAIERVCRNASASDADGEWQQQSEGMLEEEWRRPGDIHQSPGIHTARRLARQRRWEQFAAYCEEKRDVHWADVESPVRGVANGVAHRVDKLKALGNANLPQAYEWLGRRIMEHAS